MKNLKLSFTLVLALQLCACSPFTAQLKSLDKDYHEGRIPTESYYGLRAQLMAGENQWRAQLAANMQNVSANLNQVSANINQQNATNAYNYRTQVLSRPQQVNVYHSGYINQNVSGTLYLKPY